MLLDYDYPAGWPPAVAAFLDEHSGVFEDWTTTQRFATGSQYDRLVEQLGELLRPHEILAWHCSRLLPHERGAILEAGMNLPSVEGLVRRIDAAMSAGAFSSEIAAQFRRRHQALSPTRARRIWFLFTRSHNDDGVEDFFRFWGGESLYAAIDRDPELGPILRATGVPCVIEAAIPMAYFQDSLGYETHVVRQFCGWRTGRSYDGIPHDRALAPVPPHLIRRLVTFHDPDFAALSGCANYFEPLMIA